MLPGVADNYDDPDSQASGARFDDRVPQAVAVYCSDGRFAPHFNRFIMKSLGLTLCDRIVVPGGPAYLTDHRGFEADGASVLDQILWMVTFRDARRIILIMHEDCGCYARRLGYPSGPSQQRRQIEDLGLAVQIIHDACPRAAIECYLAMIDGDTVRFDRVEVQ